MLPSALHTVYITYFMNENFQGKLYAKFFIARGFLVGSHVTKAK